MERRTLLLLNKPYNICRISISLFGAIFWIFWIIFQFSTLNKSIPTGIVMLYVIFFVFPSLFHKLVSIKTTGNGEFAILNLRAIHPLEDGPRAI